MSIDASEASLTWQVMPDMLCILDQEGRFHAVNPAWQATLGWHRDDMLGRPYPEFLHPDDLGRSAEAFAQVRRGEPVLRFENRYRTPAGDYRWLSWVAVPESGRFYCTARDVTEDKERAGIIARQRTEAELREQFLAVLGHDLRNPVAALEAGTRLLLRRAPDAETTDILRRMQGSVFRMSELIENLMDLARVRLGEGIELERLSRSDLAEHLKQVIGEIGLVAPDSEIKARLEIDGPVRCDVARIKQVMANLLANAVTHGTASEPILVDARNDAGRLRISVTNKGGPIPEAAKEMLFQPFFRSTARKSQQGLGLGLYVASEIAKAHGGTLDAMSSEDETRFILDLPA